MIYLMGGQDSSGNQLSTVYAYNPATDTWTQRASMPSTPGSGSDDRPGWPYLCRRRRGFARSRHGGSRGVQPGHRYLDATGHPGFAANREHYLGFVTGPDGNLYAIGGSGVSGVLDTVQAYNPATNTWNTQTTPMPQPRSVLGVAVGTDGRIYAVNGANAYGNLTLVEALTLHPTVVADAPLTSSGTSFTTLQGRSYTGVVASFTDADPNGTASDYSATIDWGTGQTSTGVITPNGSGGFNVTGTNIYSVSGTDAITVTISDVGGSSTVATSSATVTPTSIGIIHTLAGGATPWISAARAPRSRQGSGHGCVGQRLHDGPVPRDGRLQRRALLDEHRWR